MKKEQVLATVGMLPDEFHAEELIERIIFMAKLRDAEEGRTITLGEAREYMAGNWSRQTCQRG